MTENPYKVFHSSCELLRKKLHVILVRPEEPGNVGSVARALENMGLSGRFVIVGNPHILETENCQKLAKHAKDTLSQALCVPTLKDAFEAIGGDRPLSLAATARIGSAQRPHPLRVREAVEKAVGELQRGGADELSFVFGPEGSGLTNEEIELCDWVVTIPSEAKYRSLNLAQAVMVFCYEANVCFIEEWKSLETGKPSQKERLVRHILELSEEAGFILPGDPFKMKPRLESILAALPPHIPEVKTLHGLLDQVRRSLGKADIRGRYKFRMEESRK